MPRAHDDTQGVRLIAIRARPFGFGKFMVTLELIAFFFISLRPATDPDYGWHVVNGSHVLDGKIFGGRDLYSWTSTELWVAHEWVTELFMKAGDLIGGRTLNSFLAALIIVCVYALLAVTLRRRSCGWGLIFLALLVAFSGALRSLAVRPHVIEMLGVALASLLVDAYLRGSVRARSFLALFGIGSVIWANMHGSFPLACAIAGIASVELLISRDARWRVMAIAALVSAACFVLNPWGVHLYEFALQSLQSAPTQSHIQEWQRPLLTEWIAVPLILQLILVTIAIAGVALRRSPSAQVIPPAVGTLRAVAFGTLALMSGRHVMIFGIATIAILALGLKTVGEVLRLTRRNQQADLPPPRGIELINAGAVLVVAAVVTCAGWNVVSPSRQTRALASQYPVAILPSLQKNFKQTDRMFNEYRWGGFLIERSTIPVFIDGRSELYGDSQLARYASIVHLERGWKERLHGMGITHVLMPNDSKLARALAGDEWHVVARDTVGVLLKRNIE